MAEFLRGRDEGRKETAVLHKNPMTFDWPRSRKPIQVTLWMGNRGALTDVKNAHPSEVLDTDRLWMGTDGDSAGGDDARHVFDGRLFISILATTLIRVLRWQPPSAANNAEANGTQIFER